MNSNQHIAIIGGLGPQASLTLHKNIIKAAALQGAVSAADYPQITHLSLPIKEFLASSSDLDMATKTILAAIQSTGFCLWQS